MWQSGGVAGGPRFDHLAALVQYVDQDEGRERNLKIVDGKNLMEYHETTSYKI